MRERPGAVAVVGAVLVMLGELLSPGIFWGERDTYRALNAVANLIFVAGVATLLAAAVAWGRGRKAS